jgi:hypothetical protein
MNKIEFIKDEFLNPTPILYLCRGIIETSLKSRDFNTTVNIVKSDKQNEVSTLAFDIPFSKDRKITIDDCDKLVKFENDYYLIKEIEVEDGSTPNIKISCESENTELKGIYCETINAIGVSPYDMYLAIMNSVRHPIDLTKNYKWAGTDVVNKFRHLQCEEEQSVFQNFVSLAEVFNGWLEFTTDESGQNWIFLRTQEIDDGKFIKKNLDMKTLNITSDSKEIFTQVELFGKQDELTGQEINIMTVNPNGKSCLENYSYYLSKGIPTSNIDNEPKYQQLKVIRDEKYTTPQDLYDMGIEELAKCSIPKIDASLTLSDLSIHIDSPIIPPVVGHKLLCIDKDIDFIFTCKIIGVERPYNNPADVKIEISNVNRYDTAYQNINHTVDNANKVISTDPTNTDGQNTGDSKPYIKMSDCKDGDHWNATKRFADTYSLATQQSDLISLRVDEQNQSFAELQVTANMISTHVEDISDTNHRVYSEIQQTARNIKAVVVEDQDSGSVELNKDKFVVAFNGSTNRNAVIDRNVGLILGNPDTGTFSQIEYGGKLSLMMQGEKHPYHCLVDGGVRSFECTDSGYTTFYINLPNKFSGIDDSEITVISSVRKVYDTNIDSTNNICFWFGCYASCVNGRIQVDVMSKWRTVQYEDDSNGDSWVKDINGEKNGLIDISYVIIA